jgi:uncharacterized protein (TIGR03435 family)
MRRQPGRRRNSVAGHGSGYSCLGRMRSCHHDDRRRPIKRCFALPPNAGAVEMPPASKMPAGSVAFLMSPSANRMVRGNMTMERFATFIAGMVDRPVIDKTGLTGTYAIELSYRGDENDAVGRMPSVRGEANTPGDQEAATPTATLAQAVQETLGLKLEAKKEPVEIIVIDSANKVPTEN